MKRSLRRVKPRMSMSFPLAGKIGSIAQLTEACHDPHRYQLSHCLVSPNGALHQGTPWADFCDLSRKRRHPNHRDSSRCCMIWHCGRNPSLGVRLVLVHATREAIDAALPPECHPVFHHGIRVTDDRTLAIASETAITLAKR